MASHLAPLSLRNTPVIDLGSPAEMLVGRVLWSTVPKASVALKPKHPKYKAVISSRHMSTAFALFFFLFLFSGCTYFFGNTLEYCILLTA